MYARVASFENVDIEKMEAFSQQSDAERPALPEGVRKMMMFVDRAGRRSRFVTFFDTREAIDAAEATFERMGNDIPEEDRGRRTSVEVWEVVHDETV